MSQAHLRIIALWDSIADLANDVGASVVTVRKWRQRQRIPSAHWSALLKAAAAKNKPVTFEMLAGGDTESDAEADKEIAA
jgi:uncharacterized protein YjcR